MCCGNFSDAAVMVVFTKNVIHVQSIKKRNLYSGWTENEVKKLQKTFFRLSLVPKPCSVSTALLVHVLIGGMP